MPAKDRVIGSGNLYLLDENGKTVGELGGTLEFEPEQIEASCLDDKAEIFITGNCSMKFEMKNVAISTEIFRQVSRGEKVYYEISCICDGTLYYAIQLARVLKGIGCVCIHVKSETIEDANPPWMNCRFIATGVMRNTNNWRRMHGLPMISRKMFRTRKDRQKSEVNHD